MQLFDVYPLFDIEPVKAEGCKVWDKDGNEYLDLYGGHAVISIGHSHPHYITTIRKQLDKIGFYSNSVINSLQQELADKLGASSDYDDYQLFLCNTGAEAIENALKLASFHNERKKVIVFGRSFHGRTSGAVAITDNQKIQAPINPSDHVVKIEMNDLEKLEKLLKPKDVCAVVIEGIQGIGGIYVPEENFLQEAQRLCKASGTLLILDEIQSGYGRTGRFFAHQYADIRPDLITMAKGMGNGFPIGGVLISPEIKAWHGMLGTTFGGNHLACAAGIAVLDVLKSENLIAEASVAGNFLIHQLAQMPGVQSVRGLGLMIGIEMPENVKGLRMKLIKEHRIFTGSSSQANVLRLLPPLCINQEQASQFLTALQAILDE